MARKINDDNMFFKYCWDFLHVYLTDQIGRSTHTINSYIDSLTIFKNFLISYKKYNLGEFTFNNCTTDLIFEYIKWLENKGNSAKTINHRVTGIKGYLYYATIQDVSLDFMYSKICKIKPLKYKRVVKEILTDKQIGLILQQSENNSKGIRNRVMLLTLYETACRVNELINMKKQDLYLERDNPTYLFMVKVIKKDIYQLLRR